MGKPRLVLLALVLLLGCGENSAVVSIDPGGNRLVRAVRPDSSVGKTYRAALEFLSDDLLEGRAPNTRGGALAARFIAAEFSRLGLEPAGDDGSYFHRVPIISLDPTPSLTISGGGLGQARLRYREDYVLWSMRDEASVSVDVPLVYVGYGIVAPEYGWDDYAGVDVAGKAVLVLVNDPGLVDSTVFKGSALTYYGRWTYKIEEAARQGAAAILMVHTTGSATYPWATVATSWTGPQVRLESEATSLVAAGWLSRAVAEGLGVGSGASADQLLAVAARSDRGGLSPAELPVRVRGAVRSTVVRSETYNVVARLTGWGPDPDQSVMIGGHYDHLGIGTPLQGDSIYNGAVDNASGTAAVIAAAEAFVSSGVHPDRSILFMAFGAEESGLLGSKAFAARPTLPLSDLAAVINLDGLNLYGATNDASALGLDQTTLGEMFTAAAAAENLSVSENRDAIEKGYFFRSDHFPLVLAGVPALSIQTGQSFRDREPEWGKRVEDEYTAERYHQPSDELLPWYRIDGALQQLRVALRTAMKAAMAPKQPEWLEGSEFSSAGKVRVSEDGGGGS